MFFTSNCFLADMPKVKTEWSDFTIFWAKILLPPAEREPSILTCWIWNQYWTRATSKSKTYLLHKAPNTVGSQADDKYAELEERELCGGKLSLSD